MERTSSVMAMAKTPSLKASTRALLTGDSRPRRRHHAVGSGSVLLRLPPGLQREPPDAGHRAEHPDRGGHRLDHLASPTLCHGSTLRRRTAPLLDGGTPSSHHAPMSAPLTAALPGAAEVRRWIEEGSVDTVVVAFPDLQGRPVGKRVTGPFFLDHVEEHGIEACDYLLALDVDLQPVPGYRFTGWETG